MSMTRLAVFAAAMSLFASHAVPAQELKPAPPIAGQESTVPADVEVTLIPNWQIGDSYRIEQLSEREEIRRGQRSPKFTARSLSKVEVVEATGGSYVLAATLVETDLSNSAAAVQGGADTAALLTELFQGKTTELATNENGVPVGLRNKDEMVELMRAGMEGVLTTAVSDRQKRQAARSILEQMMTPDVIEAMAIKDAVTFYGLMGGIYQGGPAQAYDLPMPFPFTQEMVDATLYVLLRRVDDSAGTVYITTQNVPDAAQTKRALKSWLTGVVQSQGQTLPPGFQFPEFTMQDTIDYVIDRNRMLPTEVTWERYIRMGNDLLRVDRDVFRMKPAS